MPITTNLNISPYFDDYNRKKDFGQILFRPAVAIQARELTQLQTILQNQIELFGDNIYKEGTIIKGASFSFDNSYNYVKLLDNRVDAQPLNVLQHSGQWVRGGNNGIIASIVAVDSGLQSSGIDLNTFFVKYINSSGGVAGFIESEILSIYPTETDAVAQINQVAQIAIADAVTFGVGVVGKGYSFSVTDGVIFQKGHFVRVSAQSVVVSKYSNLPNNLAVGFETKETITTENNDTSLLDNAAGFTNVNAPGAHRLTLTPTLTVKTTPVTSQNFFALVEFQGGKIVKSRQLTQFSSIGREFARRTHEEAGDYVVQPFKILSEPYPADSSKLNLIVSSGIGYVQGYRVENTNNNIIPIDKGLSTSTLAGQSLSVSYGSFIIVKEMEGVFNHSTGATISLRDSVSGRLTSMTFSTPTAPGAEIGKARIVGIERISGIDGSKESRHRIYINDIKMNAAKNFKDVKAIWFSSGVVGVADLVLEGSPAAAVLKEPSNNALIFPFSQTSLKTITNANYIYRYIDTTTSFTTGGILSVTVPNPDVLPYGGSATLSEIAKSEITVVTTGVGVSSSPFTGAATAALSGLDNLVTGTGTFFLTQFKVGQYIQLVTQGFRRIIAITSNTELKVDTAWVVATGKAVSRYFPAYTSIPLVSSDVIVTTNVGATTLSVNLNMPLAATLTTALSASIYVSAKKVSASSGQITKTSTKTFVKIDTATHSSSNVGPWSLGLPDVWAIDAVYEGNSYSTLNTNATSKFSFTTGQKDSHYGLAELSLKAGSTITASNKLLIEVESFVAAATGGYFTLESYPVDDSATPAANTITTELIPIHISDSGQEFDLRDAVDCRPVSSATATVSSTVLTAAINPASSEVIYGTLKLPSPNKTFDMTLTNYLGRVDTIVVDSYGTFFVVPGVASDNPKPSKKPDGTMLIGYATIPPFPTLTTKSGSDVQRPEYTVLIKQIQQKRFTMDDIGSIDRRLSSVEYYTSLNLLEKSAADMFIPSASTGQNRFKHGIFVDNFETVLAGDFTHPEFSVGYNSTESSISSRFEVFHISLKYSSGTKVSKVGDLVIGNYAEVEAISQKHASRVRNTAESFWNWTGSGTILPAYDYGFDTTTNPVSTSTSPAINSIVAVNNAKRTSTRFNFASLGGGLIGSVGGSGSISSWGLLKDN